MLLVELFNASLQVWAQNPDGLAVYLEVGERGRGGEERVNEKRGEEMGVGGRGEWERGEGREE